MDEPCDVARNTQQPQPRAQKAVSRIVISALMGVALGVAFPVVSTLISLLATDMSPSWKAVVHLHTENPLLQVIDSIPIVLGLAFGLVGRAVGKLESLIAGLEVRIEHRTEALRAEKTDAEGRARSKSGFLAHLSRELGKSVDVVLRDCEILLGSRLDARQKELAQQSHSGMRQIRDTLRSVLTLSEAECGELRLNADVFEVSALIDRVLDKLAPRMSSDLEIEVNYANALPERIVADQTCFMKVFVTTLRAAILGSRTGVLRVSVSQTTGMQGRLSILHIELENSTMVIPPAELERMFSSLETSDAMSFAQDSRAELELAVVKRLSLAMGGDIGVQSSSGRGTRFFISLPFDDEDAAGEPAPALGNGNLGLDMPSSRQAS